MASPFQSDGLVWSNDKGMFLFDNIPIPMTTKPTFNFNFHALYCEPTLCKRVLNDIDYQLSDEDIAEVQAFIQAEKLKPQLVNGVDANGKYLQNVDVKEVIRVVKSSPPERGMWRLDPNSLYEEWVRVYPVDSNGLIMDEKGIIEDSQIFAIIRTKPPEEVGFDFIRKWKWNFLANKWVDGETYDNKIKVIQERKIENLKELSGGKTQTQSITIDIGGTNYTFGITRSILQDIIALIIFNQGGKLYPYGMLEPITISHTDLIRLGQAILIEQEKINNEFYEHKKSILSTVDEQELKDYDITKKPPKK